MITYTGFTWVQLLTFAVSAVLPALVALITKRMAAPALKAVTLLFLAALTGLLSELLDALVTALPFDFGTAAANWLMAFIVAVAAHYGLLKPLKMTGSQGAIATAVPGGLGADDPGRHSVDAIVARLQAERRSG
ncbi:hypothetical protein [Blastococcus sp. CT_GayMR16]|uniref:hypothetical protein n=1 Tax=Blastococcus sp. CT_GayMR16 TaxID=2559607 RepID=UPI0010733032|nr:hypothetical protein [Blastococcus sp. CT_GayMR16]TFV90377.1 hypothetical protein E4P38_02755 [Blastococcus sp. CT_GayMR16]